MITPEDGVYANIPDEDYHADKGSLSSSGARTLLWDSPAKYRAEQDKRPTPKAEYDFGHVAHRLILGKGAEIVVVDADSWRSDAAKLAQSEAREAGQVAILGKDYARAEEMAAAVREHPLAGALFAKGDAEVSGWWTDISSGAQLRWRADWLHPGKTRLIIVDYKTAKSARPQSFAKSIADYRYHQQHAWYCDGVIANGLDTDPLFLFVAQEKTYPYLVSVNDVEPYDAYRGQQLNRKAIDIYAECTATGRWPGYGDDIHTAEFPAYQRYREEAALA